MRIGTRSELSNGRERERERALCDQGCMVHGARLTV